MYDRFLHLASLGVKKKKRLKESTPAIVNGKRKKTKTMSDKIITFIRCPLIAGKAPFSVFIVIHWRPSKPLILCPIKPVVS